MNQIFRFLETSEVRAALCELLGVSDDVLLHPRKEWIRAIIEGLRSDRKDGPTVLRALKTLSETREPFRYWRGKEDLCEVMKIGSEELNRLIRYPLSLGLVIEEVKDSRQGFPLAVKYNPTSLS
jgi:hypothetical protein